MKKQPSNWIEGMAMELKDKKHRMEDQLQELMTITMEECGELIQQCSKAIRCDNYHDNEKLIEEVGDVMCMMELMHEYDLISWEDVYERVEVKKKKLKRWSNLI
tara:strand:- start:648 stop:959 length:312 start_codon:yes stop_codon:yes gene_type:complete